MVHAYISDSSAERLGLSPFSIAVSQREVVMVPDEYLSLRVISAS